MQYEKEQVYALNLFKQTFFCKEGLVSLWDDVENPPHSLSKEASSTSKVPDHFIEKLWQRVVGESLVVGVKLTESFSL